MLVSGWVTVHLRSLTASLSLKRCFPKSFQDRLPTTLISKGLCSTSGGEECDRSRIIEDSRLAKPRKDVFVAERIERVTYLDVPGS